MAEGTYEFECMRAELLGLEKPNKEEFEREAEKLRALQEEKAALEAEILENQDESLNKTGGRLDELNSILSATQKKLNRFKKTACGSLTNIFKGQSIDEDSSKIKDNTDKLQNDTDNVKADTTDTADVNDALTNLDEMENIKKQTDMQIAKNASLDIQNKMTSHLGKLDSLINKAETAEISMSAQNKQMRTFLK